MKANYSYQSKAADAILNQMMSGKYVSSVLAACPGAGKTTISQMIVNRYIAMLSGSKVVVLTEGQNTLKNQYTQELDQAHIKIDFSYGDFESNAQVRIGLPQSISKLDWTSIDLLVIDEAHNFYFADMVQDIIRKLQPKHTLLMTGSPTKFNLHNQNNRTQYGMYYIAADELQKMGVFSAASTDVVKVSNKKDPISCIRSALQTAKNQGDDTSKIMVACPSIAYANSIASYMTEQGRKVALSTSQNDQEDLQIAAFKSGQADVLVVVGKGILGFNDSNITLLIDLKSSDNLDSSYQLFARILRKHPRGVSKNYYRIADTDKNHQVLILHKMLGLMKKDVFMGFNGKNMKLEFTA